MLICVLYGVLRNIVSLVMNSLKSLLDGFVKKTVGTTNFKYLLQFACYLSNLFGALAKAGINIEMISTSEIRISVITSDDQVEDAARAVHTAFGLDSEIEAVVYAGTGR